MGGVLQQAPVTRVKSQSPRLGVMGRLVQTRAGGNGWHDRHAP